jgi:glycosyltransferase involved in cell wall biosynthesis
MKVLYVLDGLANGGTENSVAMMISHFSPAVDLTVVYIHPKEDLLGVFKAAGCKLIGLGITKTFAFGKGVSRLRKIIRQEKPDLVVSSLYEASIISRIAGWMSAVPVAGTFVTDSYGNVRRAQFRGMSAIKFHFTWLLDKITAGIPIKYFSNGKHIAESNASALGIAKSKVKIIYRGRETSQFAAWANPVSKNFTLVNVGRMVPLKGHSLLLKGFAALRQHVPDARLILVGDGLLRSALEQEAHELQVYHSIEWKGNQINGWRAIYEGNVFVFPSAYEGFSGALIEAMLTGIPVVASDIPMNKEAIDHKVNGFLFESGNPDDLCRQLLEVHHHFDNAVAMGHAARTLALQQFDIAHIATQFEAAMQEAIGSVKKNHP